MPGATGSFYDAVVGRTSSSDGVDGVLLASVFSDFRGNIRRVGGNKKLIISSRNWLATIIASTHRSTGISAHPSRHDNLWIANVPMYACPFPQPLSLVLHYAP